MAALMKAALLSLLDPGGRLQPGRFASEYGNVERKWSVTANWRSNGDGQDIPIQVVESGPLRISANVEVAHAAGALEITVGDQKLTTPITETGRLDLGELELSAGTFELQIRLKEVPTKRPAHIG